MRRLWLPLLFALTAACASLPAGPGRQPARVLIFSHTTGYRHASIDPARPALSALVEAEGGEAVLSEDPAIFTDERLREFRAILFLSTTTDPKRPESEWLTGTRRGALQRFVRSGGGIVGVHAAADSHYHWPWYGKLIGAYFQRHPAGTPQGRLKVVAPDHRSTRPLPKETERVDEWYFFKDVQPGSRLLVVLDPASIGESAAAPAPISWTREVEGARVFYTAMGHTAESYADPYFLAHVRGGLHWVLGRR